MTAFISSARMDASLSQLNAWLATQSINVPSGWVDACVAWLVSEHGGLESCTHLTQEDWCQLIYEQWLHSDMRQLSCPVLPIMPAHTDGFGTRGGPPVTSKTMKLEGELCLQVEGLFNVSDSYYSQLRQHEGNISVNLPYLDNLEADLGADPDQTHMTQAVSQAITATQTSGTQQPSAGGSLSLFLTDGVSKIKAVEFGTMGNRSTSRPPLSFADLSERLRPGVKVRLRGPLLLRTNVLLLPAGTLQTLSNPQLQVLGGEVDELLESRDGDLMYQLGLLLARKMNLTLSEDGSLPSWFPRITAVVRPTEVQNIDQLGRNDFSNTVEDREQSGDAAPSHPPPRASASPAIEPWDETWDDAFLNEAEHSLEQNLVQDVREPEHVTPNIQSRQTLSGGLHANTSQTANRPIDVDETDFLLENEVDPDVFAEALEDIDNGTIGSDAASSSISCPRGDALEQSSTFPALPIHCDVVSTAAKPQSSKLKTELVASRSPAPQESDDLLPPAPKRKPWERKPFVSRQPITGSSSVCGPLAPTSSASQTCLVNFKFHPFCYIEDMYNELMQADSKASVPPRRIYTIRGLLISLLSSLEHHQGTRWTLAARLADGSATVDVDISPDLLTEWIGLTASESESLRQMSRNVAPGSGSSTNNVAVLEAQKHRQRLRTALSNFQARLSNLAGVFDLTPPPLALTSLSKPDSDSKSIDDDKPLRPILVAYRELNGSWLRELHERVSSRGYLQTLPT